jgi:hypothetical protein
LWYLPNFYKLSIMDEILVLKLKLDASATIKTTDDLIQRNKELAKLIKQAPIEGQEGYEELADSVAAAGEEFAKNRQQILKFNQGLREVDVASDSMKGLSRQLRELEKEYKNLNKEEREFGSGADLKEKISSVRGELKDLEADLGDYRRNVGNYPEDTNRNFFNLGDTIKKIGVAAAASLTFDKLVEGAKKVAEITQEFRDLRGAIQNVTGATGQDLDGFTTGIQSISKTFGEETDKVLKAANALTKNLTGDFNESLALIEQGFLSGADANGELLDSLIEYPALIAEAGLSADQFLNVISQSAKEGVFSDKGVDAIKEAGLKLREQTKATQDAVVALFGETEGKNLLGQIESGEVEIIDAIQQVSGKLNELPPQSKIVGTAIADIFGGAGEDAGIEFLKTLENIDASSASFIDTTNELTRSQIRQLQGEKMLAEAQNETSKRFGSLLSEAKGLGNTIQVFLYDVLNQAFDFFEPIISSIVFLVSTIFDLVSSLGIFEAIGLRIEFFLGVLKFAFDGVALAVRIVANVLSIVVEAVVAISDGFAALIQVIGQSTGAFELFENIILGIVPTFNGIVASIKQLGTNFVNFFSDLLLSAQIFAKEINRTFTVREGAVQQLDREIAALVSRQSDLAEAGRTVGEAFSEEFERSLAELDANEALQDIDVDAPAAESGQSAARSFQSSFNAEIDKSSSAQKLADSIPETVEKAIAETSVDGLREKLNELSSILNTLAPNSKEFLDVAEQVKQATEKLNEAEKAREEALLTSEQLLERKQKLADDLAKSTADASKKVLEQQKLEIDSSLALDKLAAQALRDQKLADENLTADERLGIQEAYNLELSGLELQAEKARLELLKDGSIEKLNLQSKIADEELAIRQKLYDEDVEKSKEAEKKKQEAKKRFSDIALEVAQTISDAAFTIVNSELEKESEAKLSALEKETEAKIEAAGGNQQAEIEIKKEAEKKKEEIEKESAKKRKAAAITQAIINGALAAVTTLANTTVPYPAALALLIPTAAAVAAQIAVISSQKFEKGKAPGFIAKGRLHSQGGIPVSLGGREQAEIEDGEAIIARLATSRNLQQLSDINQDGGGIQFPGTAKLTLQRKKNISLYNTIVSQKPILAARGSAPRIQSLITKKRKFQDGSVVNINSTNVPITGFSEQDIKLLIAATKEGTQSGLRSANIAEQYKRQIERETELETRSDI